MITTPSRKGAVRKLQACQLKDWSSGHHWTYPEWSRDTVLVGHRRALQQSRCPGPGRHNSTGNQSRLDTSTGCVEFFTHLGRVFGVTVLRSCLAIRSAVSGLSYLEVRDTHHDERKEESNPDDDTVSRPLREDWRNCRHIERLEYRIDAAQKFWYCPNLLLLTWYVRISPFMNEDCLISYPLLGEDSV